ncbi:amidohydrolase [Jiangella ureilytica]|uniref:amidohydrolase n=1 Tax=Jiangella ureilytica TaxID=2530374 RepID=UPI0013A5CD60|nr:amidohydrolase family protein [Jiangella ureilytica]
MTGVGATAAHAADTATPAGASTPGVRGDTDLALVNGRIHTMDADDTVVSHVLIRNGRFIAVGNGPVRAQGRPFDVVNLRGRTVIPGIIDNHNHIVLMGNRPGHHTPLENAASIADVQKIYAQRATQLPDGAWITTIGGFHRNHLVPPDQPPRLPTRAELDDAVADHPVYLSESFSGPSATNSAGRAFFSDLGIPVGDDGSIAAGNPTGRATLALRQALLTFDERKRGAVDAIAYGLGLGVTTHLDQGAFQATNTPSDGAAHEDNFTMHLPFLSLLDEGRLDARLRINFLHMESDQATPELDARLRNAFPFFGGDLARTGGIGEFIAQGTGPTSPFLAAARRVAAAGWRAEVHSLSRTDFQQEIEAFEAVHAETPITDLRWVVAHVPFITEEYTNRLKALGGGLSLTGWRYLAGSAASNGPPFRMIVDNGIHAGMSSDGMQIAPMNPWLHMYYATTGRNARGVLINDGQQITRLEVLRLYTRDNGWFLREEDDLGSIEVGKHADVAVLDRDYFTVPDEDLKQIRSLFTVVGGKVVHDPGRWVR